MIFAWLLVMLLWPAIADATIVNASSCSKADIDTAISTAVDGDTVQIPGGTCDLTGLITITSKSIILKGVGAGTDTQCAVGGQTTYTCLRRAGPALSWTAQATGGSPAGLTMIDGISFVLTATPSGCSTYGTAQVTISGDTDSLRITRSTFHNIDNNCGSLLVRGYVRGVIDHNTFYSDNRVSHAYVGRHESWQNVGNYGDKSWSVALDRGAAAMIYLEDNQFTCRIGSGDPCFTTDSLHGVRHVFRFNSFTDGTIGNHGTESSGRPRSVRYMEAYRNAFDHNTGVSTGAVISTRGGTGIVFDNKAVTDSTGTLNRVVDFNSYRASPGQAQASYYPWGYCQQLSVTLSRSGTTATATTASEHGVHASGAYINITGAGAPFDGTAIIATRSTSTTYTFTVADSGATSSSGTMEATYDENTDAYGYPCIDQIGRGTGDLLSGEGPATDTLSPKAPLNQELDPLKCFNNTDDGTVSSCQPSASANVIVENRDFYNTNASFTGATGIGRGARSSRPATCTAGVAWWSTDQGTWNTSTTETYSDSPGDDGVLDLCTATNTWTNGWYEPYTYPHPLIAQTDSVENKRFSPLLNLRRVSWPIPYVNEEGNYAGLATQMSHVLPHLNQGT